jgi:hypothetical protein
MALNTPRQALSALAVPKRSARLLEDQQATNKALNEESTQRRSARNEEGAQRRSGRQDNGTSITMLFSVKVEAITITDRRTVQVFTNIWSLTKHIQQDV